MLRRSLFLLFTAGLAIGFPKAWTPAESGVFAHTGSNGSLAVSDGAENPAVSPEGRRIAAAVLGRIWVFPIEGGEGVQLTDGLSWDNHPAWSPDGQFIAYARRLPNGTDLVIHNLATAGSTVIYHTEGGVGQIAYSPRGENIFFLLDKGQYDSHLWRLPIDGSEPKQITYAENWHEWSFALSPDATRVLVDSGKYGGSNLYLIKTGDLSSKRITNTQAHDFSTCWSKDGKTWAYIERDNGVDSVIVQPAGGGQPGRVFSSPYDQKGLALLPDGQAAVLCAHRHLYRLDLGSGQLTEIPFVARLKIPDRSKAEMVIVNARLFDGTGKGVLNGATIEISQGQISAVTTGTSPQPPAGVQVIDADGRFVLPGLMDNHYHYWNPFDGADLLKRGITSIRDPGAPISTSANYREAISLGLISGPDIYACGPLIDGPGGYHPMVDVELNKPEAAAPLVRALKRQGVDALKVYFMLDPPVLAAVIKEAHTQGLRVTGHIGVHTGWREAMSYEIDGFNHIRVWKDFLPRDRQPQGDHESLDASKNIIARMQADWTGIDPTSPQVQALIKMMADKQVGFDPTLSIQFTVQHNRSRLSLEEFDKAQIAYERMGQFVARAAAAGVMLLAGTDDGSLFAEMESYADAGVPNKVILQAATANGARWLHKEEQFGTIQAGKRADVLIVDGDPLMDIKDLRKVWMVVKGGRIVFRK
jgi:hypothetical protein